MMVYVGQRTAKAEALVGVHSANAKCRFQFSSSMFKRTEKVKVGCVVVVLANCKTLNVNHQLRAFTVVKGQK